MHSCTSSIAAHIAPTTTLHPPVIRRHAAHLSQPKPCNIATASVLLLTKWALILYTVQPPYIHGTDGSSGLSGTQLQSVCKADRTALHRLCSWP
jgi:hypothetical protein